MVGLQLYPIIWEMVVSKLYKINWTYVQLSFNTISLDVLEPIVTCLFLQKAERFFFEKSDGVDCG